MLRFLLWGLFFYIPSVYSMQGELEVFQNDEIYVGDTLKAKLKIWPYTSDDKSIFNRLENKSLIDFFHVISINRIQNSKSDSEVLEIFLTLAIKKVFVSGNTYNLKYSDLNVPIKLPWVKIVDQKLEIKDFKKWNQKQLIDVSHKYRWLIFIGTLVVVILFLVIRRRKIHDDGGEDIQKIKDLVNKAYTRKSIEEIYKYKTILKEIYSEKKINDFLNTLNECQYKPKWTDQEKVLIREKLDCLRSET